MSDLYASRGVSAGKEDVHAAIKNLGKGLYPHAFCKILPDYVGGDEQYCNMMHCDTAGTKTAIAYIYYKETGDISVWKGIVQDAMVMNIDDMLCSGVSGNILISSNIARNKNKIGGEVIAALIQGAEEFCNQMTSLGVPLYMAGGETADVGDIVRTIDVGYTAFARLPKSHIIDPVHVKAGDVIVGLASYGQSTYEAVYNSGIGCNGLTSARHDLLNKTYKSKYPEALDPALDDSVAFLGPYQVTDEVDAPLTIGKLLLSPTRTFAPVIKDVLELHRTHIHAIIHNTGGAASKCLHYLPKGLNIIKDNYLPVPRIFELIQNTAHTSWQEMFKVFNMGTRLEVYTDESTAQEIISIARKYNIDAQVIGRVEVNENPELSKVSMHTSYGDWEYLSQ